MKVTVRIKGPSNWQAQAENQVPCTVTCGPSALSGDRAAKPTVPGSCADEELVTVSGINSMNHLFELPDKPISPISDSSSTIEKTKISSQLQQVPREEVCVLPDSRIVTHSDPLGAGADRFRLLRIGLRELWNTGKLKSLLITSPMPQDGKSTIALNLATALAEGGKRTVLLIEADLHRPTLTSQLNLVPRPGLADCLEGSLSPLSAILRLEPLNFYFLPAGEPRTNPKELLQSDALSGVLQELAPHFDWILIDSPPVIPLTDAILLARQTNATLLVAREGRTRREAIEKAIALVGRQRVVGIILNAVDGLDRLYSGYYENYGYPATNGSRALSPLHALSESTERPTISAKPSATDPK
jgi:capsular exopolysaccharide synthesis family protein